MTPSVLSHNDCNVFSVAGQTSLFTRNTWESFCLDYMWADVNVWKAFFYEAPFYNNFSVMFELFHDTSLHFGFAEDPVVSSPDVGDLSPEGPLPPLILLQQLLSAATQPSPIKAIFDRQEMEVSQLTYLLLHPC